ncbi:MAG: hypothetical protein AAB483_03730 [Patescibacteria group bacterium]
MQRFLTVLGFLLASTYASAQINTVVDLRLGMRDQVTYRYAEVFQVRDRWIFPDIGYVDFGGNDYREFFVGGGRKLFVSKPLTVIEILYFEQATGSAGDNARWLIPWTLLAYEFHPRLGGEAVFFPYLPLNEAGRIQYVVDHATLQYSFSDIFKAGVGYGAYQFGDDQWQHKPFVIGTLTPAQGKFGSFEAWLQKLPDGKAQIQFRYKIVHKTRKPRP